MRDVALTHHVSRITAGMFLFSSHLVLGVAVTRFQEAKGATAREVEGVRHDRVQPILGSARLDDRALRWCQVYSLRAVLLGVVAAQRHTLLDHRVEDRADDMERAIDIWAGVQHKDPHALA